MPLPDQLPALLDTEVECLRRLLATLEQEYEALTSGDVEKLEKVTLAKNATMAEQVALAQQRGRIVAAAGFDNSNAGLETMVTQSVNPEPLNASLQALGELAQQCQHYNRENGRIIVQKQQQTQSALNILRQSDTTAPTYSIQGTTAASEDSRSLGKA